MPLLVGARLNEELHLHLLELAGPEDEVAGSDLVAEALAGLTDAEGRLLASGVHHVEVVDEDALCRFWPEVVQGAGFLDRSHGRAQHSVEVTWLGEFTPRAAVGAHDVRKPIRWGGAVLLLVGIDELIGPPALVALLALGQGVDERRHVTGGLPHLWGKDDGGVESYDIIATAYDGLPPLPADVFLEFDAERTVVPGRSGAPVDLRRGEDESPSLAQVDDSIDTIGHDPLRLGVGGQARQGRHRRSAEQEALTLASVESS